MLHRPVRKWDPRIGEEIKFCSIHPLAAPLVWTSLDNRNQMLGERGERVPKRSLSKSYSQKTLAEIDYFDFHDLLTLCTHFYSHDLSTPSN